MTISYAEESTLGTYGESRDTCEVDALKYSYHISCAECTILIGPGHLEPRVLTGNLCSNCSFPADERVLSWLLASDSETHDITA
jgi:hypothetical protein